MAAGVSENVNSISLRNWSFKTLSTVIKLANGDEAEVDKEENNRENINLSPRGIRELLNNNPIYETTAYGHFEESQVIRGNLHGKRLIKLIYLNCNLEKPQISSKR